MKRKLNPTASNAHILEDILLKIDVFLGDILNPMILERVKGEIKKCFLTQNEDILMRSEHATPATPVRSEHATPEIVEMRRIIRERGERLDSGRHYLMSVDSEEITVENTLLAFGWDRNGLGAQPT